MAKKVEQNVEDPGRMSKKDAGENGQSEKPAREGPDVDRNRRKESVESSLIDDAFDH